MNVLSVCSGIEAASIAWHPLSWQCVAVSEIAPFPCAVLTHHYPCVPNWGDMTHFQEWPDAAIDLLVGGTPCQSFSIAGRRKGLDDARGNLALTYLAIARRYRPRWLVYENVPGVLSSNGGRDFGAFLNGLEKLRYGFAWRVLDAQYFGVPQCRRRVFVVAHSGNGRCAAAVLFERESLRGRAAARKKSWQDVTPILSARTCGGGGFGTDFEYSGRLPQRTRALTVSSQRLNPETETLVVHGGGKDGRVAAGSISPIAGTLRASGGGGNIPHALMGMTVRRLTPRECERLQGFPDDYTLIPYRGRPAADTPRYCALGNSMAVPVMRWIGARIAQVDQITAAVHQAA